MAPILHGADGALDRVLRLAQKQRSTPAIFIHAGAGFHSHQNERIHLKACVSATEMGMRFLNAGATATEAVEAALRVLEDKEITNAGFGSNLSIDGTVECDATIVDHLGRSGACGAVPNIRNPISLAKLILDTSNMPLSLRRVPPNALVGDGARAFAEEHGMPTFANEYLVSKNSHDRFLRWQEDLLRAEGRVKDSKLSPLPAPNEFSCAPCQYDTAPASDPHRRFPREHAAAILAGTCNEGQTDSPYAGTPLPESSTLPESAVFSAYSRPPASSHQPSSRSSSQTPTPHAALTVAGFPEPPKDGVLPAKPKAKAQRPAALSPRRDNGKKEGLDAHEDFEPNHDGCAALGIPHATRETASSEGDLGFDAPRGLKQSDGAATAAGGLDGRTAKRAYYVAHSRDDLVTDTIGAIAIDEQGQIAAGSSSGGIGMKHRGRLGPAALFGVGTAVVPCADKDEQGLTVAAVASGTGEHMATTMASQRCAERIYQATRRGPRGFDVAEEDDDAIMQSFIADDFMSHPGVRHCHSAGAIGVMAVKKSRAGYYLYFAHNTDSFALVSMGGLDKEPHCTMSRLSEGSKIARGGRKIQVA